MARGGPTPQQTLARLLSELDEKLLIRRLQLLRGDLVMAKQGLPPVLTEQLLDPFLMGLVREQPGNLHCDAPPLQRRMQAEVGGQVSLDLHHPGTFLHRARGVGFPEGFLRGMLYLHIALA